MRFCVLFFVAAALLVASGSASGATPLQLVPVGTGLDQPVFVTSPPGDSTRLFVVEQTGRIRIIKNGTLLTTPFLNISSLVSTFGPEEGLLGLAFHPNYAANRIFFVCYVHTDRSNRVVKYLRSTGSADLADAASAKTLINQPDPYRNHNGGMMAFSPLDGMLYIGMGDGGGSGDPDENAQDSSTILGKMLRYNFNVALDTITIPPSNPFVSRLGFHPGIWAMGMRNPWRWSFDRATGDLYIGDVGQDNHEELDFQPRLSPGGQNYGWDLMEGNHCYEPPLQCDTLVGLTDPIYEYTHTGNQCSITGGYVYRGCAIPDLVGTYFCADFCSGEVWSLKYSGGQITNFTDRTDELNSLPLSISSFGEDAQGELYITSLGGTVHKIAPVGTPATCGPCCVGVRGNADNDPGNSVDITDLQVYIDFLFFGGASAICFDEFDAVEDLGIDITDLQVVIDYLFFGGSLPTC